MKQITVTAPGKLILHGEHSVVHGKKAVATSVDLRCTMSLICTEDDSLRIELPGLHLDVTWHIADVCQSLSFLWDLAHKDPWSPNDCTAYETLAKLVLKDNSDDDGFATARTAALVTFLHLYGSIFVSRCLSVNNSSPQKFPSLYVKMDSNMPIGAGLGSSAAYSACLSACLLVKVKQLEISTDTLHLSHDQLTFINQWAYQGEMLIHGGCSGLDNTLSTFGGAVAYQNGNFELLNEFPELKILLINTKVPKSTKTLVAGVRQRREMLSDIMDSILESMNALTHTALQLYNQLYTLQMAQDPQPVSQKIVYEKLLECIRLNQGLLYTIGVSHPSLEKICDLTRSIQGLESKLTGAGGGGCGFVLLTPSAHPDSISSLKSELEGLDYEVYETKLGTPGIVIEELS